MRQTSAPRPNLSKPARESTRKLTHRQNTGYTRLMVDLPMIISVDDHVVEPATLWIDRLPTKYHEVGPRIVRAPMGEITFIGGKLTVKPGSRGLPTDWWLSLIHISEPTRQAEI